MIMFRRYRLLPVLAVSLLLVLSLSGCRRSGVVSTPSSDPASTAPVSTAPAETQQGPSFSFIVCGDPQNNYDVFNRVLEAAKTVDFLIVAGDLTGSGTSTEFENFLAAVDSSGVKYYCVPGNHDVVTTPVDENYRTYMGAPYQSFDYENSHFVLIDNSTPSLGFYAAERSWVESDLEQARERDPQHIFAVCHVAPGYPYSRMPDEEELAGMEANDFLVPILATGGVEELFCGHFHAYESYEEDGMLITITGGAGAPLHMSEANGGYYHYILVEINGKQRNQKVIRI